MPTTVIDPANIPQPPKPKERTQKNILKHILDLIDHDMWTKGTLACPIYPAKIVKDKRESGGFRVTKRPDLSKPPIGANYCLVGMIIDAIGMTKFTKGAWDSDGFSMETDEGDIPDKFGGLIKKLYAEIPHEHFLAIKNAYIDDDEEVEFSAADIDISDMLDHLESWNDHDTTKKEDVRVLVQRTYDKAR